MKHPFFEKLDNEGYMDGFRFAHVELHGGKEGDINIDTEETFLKSLANLGVIKILR